jgi:uncharacterized RDD family membrane protein YckC
MPSFVGSFLFFIFSSPPSRWLIFFLLGTFLYILHVCDVRRKHSGFQCRVIIRTEAERAALKEKKNKKKLGGKRERESRVKEVPAGVME